MFSKIEGGKVINIQGLDCWIPPVGFVVDMKTKSLREIGIYSRSDIKEEQYWERIKPPEWYAYVLKEEDAYNKRKKEDSERIPSADSHPLFLQHFEMRL
mgnify:CR=1 FL=1